jgi:DNA polymerase
VIDDPALMQGAIDLVTARDVGSLDAIFGQPSTILSSLIRAVIRAPEGKTLVAADYASIESIVLAWLAGCSRLLDVFRTGRDVYKDFATALYRIEYADVTKAQRKFAKPATLGCGYMLGAKGLVAYAETMGVPMTLEQAKQCVDTFRASYFEIPILWNALDEAARACIRTGETTVAGKIRFEWSRPFLRMVLPSGRAISYLRPRIVTRETDWGPKSTVAYDGKDATGAWGPVYTHPGKFAEQSTQALARDLLAGGLDQAEAAGVPVILHVHDEIVGEVDATDTGALDRLQAALAAPPAWAPDMPLKTAGFASTFYRKD